MVSFVGEGPLVVSAIVTVFEVVVFTVGRVAVEFSLSRTGAGKVAWLKPGARVGLGYGPNKKKDKEKLSKLKGYDLLHKPTPFFFFFLLKCLRIWMLLVVKKALSCFKGCNDHCLIFVSNMFETLRLSTYIHLDHRKRTDYGG